MLNKENKRRFSKMIARNSMSPSGVKNMARHQSETNELNYKSRSEALKRKKGGHKQGERESKAKKLGYYPQGHKNYGDVYEA